MDRREMLGGMAVLALVGATGARAVIRDPLPPEGVRLKYRLSYSGTPVGMQTVFIRKHDKTGHVVIEHDTRIQVKLLFVVAYSLAHRSTEVWDGFQLHSVRSETTLNGQSNIIEGAATDQGFLVRSAERTHLVSERVVSTDSFWLAAAVQSPSVVEVRTGDSAAPKVERLEDGWVRLHANFEHGPVIATMRFDGDFLAEADVDNDGHVVHIERIVA